MYESEYLEARDLFITEELNNLEKSQIDMTLFFRKISAEQKLDFVSFWTILEDCTYFIIEEILKEKAHWEMWFSNYEALLEKEKVAPALRSSKMKTVNPKYVLRNYMAQLAIDAAEDGDNSLVDELYTLLLEPYSEQPEMEKWFAKRPDWAMHKVGCSMLSCSS